MFYLGFILILYWFLPKYVSYGSENLISRIFPPIQRRSLEMIWLFFIAKPVVKKPVIAGCYWAKNFRPEEYVLFH